jgi:hypothetical protein
VRDVAEVGLTGGSVRSISGRKPPGRVGSRTSSTGFQTRFSGLRTGYTGLCTNGAAGGRSFFSASALALQPATAGDTSRFRVTPSMAAMRELTLNERVLDKLAHITQLTAEIRQLVADGRPDELPAIESVLAPIEDHAHRLAKQLSQVPIGTVRH